MPSEICVARTKYFPIGQFSLSTDVRFPARTLARNECCEKKQAISHALPLEKAIDEISLSLRGILVVGPSSLPQRRRPSPSKDRQTGHG